ncbi:mitotic spindle assembly checkpoint protein MAD1 isoform X2 [Cervus elaphus]|uniref:mitotic spindle assembly checkpoint protein MAD1 isoform X2 n=1 Tax=Cervus elaphus TaxID=9860 RepID=UPI001CC2742D|nr:mitotic spindle assembly checkpoint protein MAD1 isoform X2 [Cervus elaphus]
MATQASDALEGWCPRSFIPVLGRLLCGTAMLPACPTSRGFGDLGNGAVPAAARGGRSRRQRPQAEGDYDQSKTKVLHLSLNPAGAARQRLREDQQQLQEECARLRELVRSLEAGGPVTAHLEAAAGLPSSREVAELKKQVESAELKNQRLKEVFQTKIQEFRKVCYTLTGYQVDITTENQYRLTSMYAEQKADCLIFKAAGPLGTKMQLLETAFSRTVPALIELHLLQQDSIPAFLSALTLDLFSRQTLA